MAAGLSRGDRLGPIVLGVLLVGGGSLWLLISLFQLDVGHYGWPLFVIVPGVVMLVAGLAAPRGPGTGLTIGGTITATIGLLLAFQNVTGAWASWAYAWALTPTAASGAAMILAAQRWPEPSLRAAGLRTLLAGLVMFAIGFIFFEGLLGLDTRAFLQFSGTAWAIFLIAAGVIWLAVALLRPARR